MPYGFWLLLVFIAVIVVYVIAKVIYYARKSEQQWQQVDTSKLREWTDDDGWPEEEPIKPSTRTGKLD
jgi:hypothetical protein